MRAISLLQPWASLVAIGAKRIETRSWPTSYRGPLLIHSSRRFPKPLAGLCLEEPFVSALFGGPKFGDTGSRVPLGYVLCVVDLVDCVKIMEDNAPPQPERSFGDYTPGRYAWHLANVRRLDRPVPAKGSLGLWTPDPATLEAVMAQLKGVA